MTRFVLLRPALNNEMSMVSASRFLYTVCVFCFAFAWLQAAAVAQVKTELYFGLSSPSGSIGDSAWEAFVTGVITPTIPEGFTVIDATGQWSDHGVSKSERSKLLLCYHDDTEDAHQRIEHVRAEYISRFDQQSVLRIDVLAGKGHSGECDVYGWPFILLAILVACMAVAQVYILMRWRRDKSMG